MRRHAHPPHRGTNPDSRRVKKLLSDLQKEKRKLLKRWEHEWWEGVAIAAEDANERGDSRSLYETMKRLRTRASLKNNIGGREVHGDILEETNSWKNHFENIQIGNNPINERIWKTIKKRSTQPGWRSANPSKNEINRAINKMKMGKAPGEDGIMVELLKWAPPEIRERLNQIVVEMRKAAQSAEQRWEASDWPDSWTTAIVIPLWKGKHPKSDKGNWRGITLLSVGVKIIARVVSERTQKISEEFMDDHQNGFRRNRGVDDVLQVSRRIAEEVVFSKKGGETIFLTLYDIEKAYPRINKEALWDLMKKKKEPKTASSGYVKHCTTTQTSW